MPLVAIIGRPNVGKSTLFNRIAGTKQALVDNQPGVTRDLNFAEVRFQGRNFTLMDTGGLALESEDELKEEIRVQVMLALDLADAVILLFDGRDGITTDDLDVVDILRKKKIPTFFTVNKIDGPKHEAMASEFYSLGVEKIYMVSAKEKIGVDALFEDITRDYPKNPEPEIDPELVGEEEIEELAKRPVRVAFVGVPNVGKSSLVNRILGEPRMIVSPIPGTTTDAIDTPCEMDGRKFILVDTAGIRRKARVKSRLETYSVVKALDALSRADVACLLIDSGERLSDQDLRVATYAQRRGCGLIFVLNKSDLLDSPNQTMKKFEEYADFKIAHLTHIPRVHISAKTGKGVGKLFDMIGEVAEAINIRIGTGEFNRFLERIIRKHHPVSKKGHSINVLYGTQILVRPPTFMLFTSSAGGLHFSWERYLLNNLRKSYGFIGTPIRTRVRARNKKDDFPTTIDPHKLKKRRK